jgi:hypothetical protein
MDRRNPVPDDIKMNHVPIRMAAALLLAAAGALIALTLMRSERLRIMWNTPLYLFDGRHKLHGGPAAAILDTPAELWIRSGASGQFVRIVPRAGIELEAEQNISMVSSRKGERTMYKLRPQFAQDAQTDACDAAWHPSSNEFFLFLEQRRYSNDVLVSYYKDAAYGPGGLFFVDPNTGAHVARGNFSTVYVPAPDEAACAGPSNWLWAAAANRQFVESAVTGAPAAAAWDARYFRRVAVPSSRSAPGQQGDLACDGSNLYLYHSASTGWLRVPVEAEW